MLIILKYLINNLATVMTKEFLSLALKPSHFLLLKLNHLPKFIHANDSAIRITIPLSSAVYLLNHVIAFDGRQFKNNAIINDFPISFSELYF